LRRRSREKQTGRLPVPVSGAIPGFLQSGDDFAIVNLPEIPVKLSHGGEMWRRLQVIKFVNFPA